MLNYLNRRATRENIKQIEVHKKNIESYQKDIQALEQEVNNEKKRSINLIKTIKN